jgi:hypothetical protein
VSNFFFLFFKWTFMCPYFFLYTHASFVILTWRKRETSTHSVELYVVEQIDGTMLLSTEHSKEDVGVYVYRDHESMK